MKKKADACGYALVGVMFILTLLSIGAMATLTYADFVAKRIAEQELADVGREFSQAIQSYYSTNPSGVRQYPKSLEDLVEDNRFAKPRRHLRRIYRDPITGETTWGSVRSLDGGIMGVYSLSEDEPIKEVAPASVSQAILPANDSKGYRRWIFGFTPINPSTKNQLRH